MRLRQHALVIAAAAGLVASLGTAGSATTSTARGGTLYVPMVSDFEHLDPARNYVGSALNFSRLLIRTLTAYKPASGAAGLEVVPDLATDTGTATNGGKTWTFHLKDGLTYENGATITAADIKYSVERSFAPELPEGPQYARYYLVGGSSYDGPYTDGSLSSIKTPDSKTIVFNLRVPVGDFNYFTTFPLFGGIPKSKDTKTHYDDHPLASGPYKISSYSRGSSLHLVRNPHWSAATDDVRTALPDRVTAQFGYDPEVIDERLLDSSGSDATAVPLDSSISPDHAAEAVGSSYDGRRSSGANGFTRFMTINASKSPFTKKAARVAVEYCVNKAAVQTARGGPYVGGSIATHVLNDAIAGAEDFNPYATSSKGDVTKGKAALKEAGLTAPVKVTLQTSQTSKGIATAQAIQTGLKRCGFAVTIKQIPPEIYYTTIGSPAKEGNLVLNAWGPDWPSGSTVIQPLFDTRQIRSEGNSVFSLYDNSNGDALNARMDTALAESDPATRNALWSKLDRSIMGYALTVPLLDDRAIYVYGSKVRNAHLHRAYGSVDLVRLGVA